MQIERLLIDEQFIAEATRLVRGARKSIWISTFKMEFIGKPRGRRLRTFFELLMIRAGEKLDVRVLINRHHGRNHIPRSNYPAERRLKDKGVKVRELPDGRICHAKIVVVDECIGIIGSHNLSVKSCCNNWEVSMMTYDPFITGQLAGIYGRMWDDSKNI